PESNKAKINEVIKLCEDRQIPNIKIALNIVAQLAYTNKHTINSGRPLREFEQVITKYNDALPMTGRRTRVRQEPQQTTAQKKKRQTKTTGTTP
ncbi:MAG: hypothetical protein ACKPKO_19190, partial [Candidatus Fonsibacter sp.]